MKPKLKQNENNKSGQGHKARFAMTANITIDVDGKKQQINLDYDVSLTVEMIDYAVRLVAGRIAQVADKISKDGVSRTAEAVA